MTKPRSSQCQPSRLYHWSGCFEVWPEKSGEERSGFRSFNDAFKRFSMYERSTNFQACAIWPQMLHRDE